MQTALEEKQKTYIHNTHITHNTYGGNMATLTLAVPKDLKQKMEAFPEMNWSEIARQAFIEKIKDLEFLKKFKEKSKVTEEDAIRLGRELNKSLAKKRKNP